MSALIHTGLISWLRLSVKTSHKTENTITQTYCADLISWLKCIFGLSVSYTEWRLMDNVEGEETFQTSFLDLQFCLCERWQVCSQEMDVCLRMGILISQTGVLGRSSSKNRFSLQQTVTKISLLRWLNLDAPKKIRNNFCCELYVGFSVQITRFAQRHTCSRSPLRYSLGVFPICSWFHTATLYFFVQMAASMREAKTQMR